MATKKLTREEILAYLALARAAKRLRDAQQRAATRRGAKGVACAK